MVCFGVLLLVDDERVEASNIFYLLLLPSLYLTRLLLLCVFLYETGNSRLWSVTFVSLEMCHE